MKTKTKPITLTVELARGDSKESPWNIIAYCAEIKARAFAITDRVLDDIMRNFERYGSDCPVVLFHADLQPDADPRARVAHARIRDLRLGTFERKGIQTKSLEAKFTWINEQTRQDVASGALNKASVTIFPNAIDEESGDDIGAYMYSVSLLNNPGLVDLPALQAERIVERSTTEQSMSTLSGFIALAAAMGIPSTSEDEAKNRLESLGREALSVRQCLGSANAQETISKINSGLEAQATLATVRKDLSEKKAQLEAFAKAEQDRIELERKTHLDALVTNRPELIGMRNSLEFHAKSDWDGFKKQYPVTAVTDSQLAQENAQLKQLGLQTKIAPQNGTPTQSFVTNPQGTDRDQLRTIALEIQSKNPGMAFDVALKKASKQLRAQ